MLEYTLLTIISYIIRIYYWLMIAAIFATWIPAVHQSRIGEWLRRLTDPFFGIFRRFIPPIGFIDISPIVAIFVYGFLTRFALQGIAALFTWFQP